MKRVDAREPAVLAELGEIDAGEDADRRADERRDADDERRCRRSRWRARPPSPAAASSA